MVFNHTKNRFFCKSFFSSKNHFYLFNQKDLFMVFRVPQAIYLKTFQVKKKGGEKKHFLKV